MVEIVFLVLAHDQPERLQRTLRVIERAGGRAMVHFDGRSGNISELRQSFQSSKSIAFTSKRIKCHWGHSSLLWASVYLAQEALSTFKDATHFYLISGSCAPIMPLAQIQNALLAQDKDFIECADFMENKWVKSGDQIARISHYHLFPERWAKRLFTLHKDVQYYFGIFRNVPAGLTLGIGSQWWCLRRETLERALSVLRRRDVRRFFQWAWIPDEIAFQSAVMTTVPPDEIVSQSPTLSAFSIHGQPFEFFEDHAPLLAQCDQFFARKISPFATGLFDTLWQNFAGPAGIPRHVSGAAYLALHQNDLSLWQDKVLPFWSDHVVPARELSLYILVVQHEEMGIKYADEVAQALGCPSLGYPWSNRPLKLAFLSDLRDDAMKRRKFWSEVLDRSARGLGVSQMVLCVNRGDIEMLHSICRRYAQVRVMPIRGQNDGDHLLCERGVVKGHNHAVGDLSCATLDIYDKALESLPIPWFFDPERNGWVQAWQGFCRDTSLDMPASFKEIAKTSGDTS